MDTTDFYKKEPVAAASPGQTPVTGEQARTDDRTAAGAEAGPDENRATTATSTMPKALLLAAAAVLIAGAAWVLIRGTESPPMLVAQTFGTSDGYRLVTGRTTPAQANALSDAFVAVDSELRSQVLQRLSEFQARWRVAGPRIAVRPYDVRGDALALAAQFDEWFTRTELLDTASSADAQDSGVSVALSGLPAPAEKGMTLRYRNQDETIAKELALALSPVLAGEVNLVPDERIDANRVIIAIVGTPQFDERGIAYFPAG